MLFRLHFLLYSIFVSYNQFLFFSCILYYVACAFVICLIKYLLTYLLTHICHLFRSYLIFASVHWYWWQGFASGSFGPTTAGRMDSYVDMFQAAGGSMIMLAKGNRSQQVLMQLLKLTHLLTLNDKNKISSKTTKIWWVVCSCFTKNWDS